MKTTKISYIVFSLAMIAALVFAAIPMTPAHAMSAAGTTASLSATTNVQTSGGILICHHIVRWYHGHRISIRICHWFHKPSAS